MANHKIKKKRPGTKPKGPYEDKRAALTTRITQSTRTALEKAANATGRSLSQEIEFRLEQSVRDEANYVTSLGGKENFALFRMMGAAAELIETNTNKSWTSDWETSLAVKRAWTIIANNVAPEPPRKFVKKMIQDPPDLPHPPTPPTFPTDDAPPFLLALAGTNEKDNAQAVREYKRAEKQFKKDMAKYEKEWSAIHNAAQARIKILEQSRDIGGEAAETILSLNRNQK